MGEQVAAAERHGGDPACTAGCAAVCSLCVHAAGQYLQPVHLLPLLIWRLSYEKAASADRCDAAVCPSCTG